MMMDITKRSKIVSILSRKPFSIQNDAFCFVDGDVVPRKTTKSGLFGALQDALKRNPRLYRFIVEVLSPVRATRKCRWLCKTLLDKYDEESIIVNYGSGPIRLNDRQDLINIDLFAFDEVDVVSDTLIPFKDESIDLFICIAVLEHIRQPQAAVSEMLRCLKSGGEFLVYVAFMQPLHAAPHDYQRWTEIGLQELFKDFTILDSGTGAGPTSGFLWVFQQWVSILLSFRNHILKDLILVVVMLMTFPLKYIDIFLESFPHCGELASGLYIHGQKPAQPKKV